MIEIDFDEVKELMNEVKTRTENSVSFDIDIWQFADDDKPHAPEFRLWVTKYNMHFSGPTLNIIKLHIKAYEKGYQDGLLHLYEKSQ